MLYGTLDDPHQEFFVMAQTQVDVMGMPSSRFTKVKKTVWQLAELILFNGKSMTIIHARKPELVESIVTPILQRFGKICEPASEYQKEGSLDMADIEACCRDMNSHVARVLWDIVVMSEYLPTHLMVVLSLSLFFNITFRDVFLAGKGDFMLELIDDLDTLQKQSSLNMHMITSQGKAMAN
eukprot:jgi/Hompol1/5016/HPOL_004091-RA